MRFGGCALNLRWAQRFAKLDLQLFCLQYLSRVVVVPLTSKTAKVYPGECLVMAGDREAKAMADQIATVDKMRLQSKMAALSETDIKKVEAAVKIQLDI